MTNHDSDSLLPLVEANDINRILFTDITDPSHKERFEHLSQTNPIITREILKRAYIDARYAVRTSGVSTIELQKIIINSVTFALSAIEESIRRTRQLSDAVDDEDQPHSDELGDDQPTE